MADDFNLIQKIADAGGNASGYCSAKEARMFLAMYRAIQEHDEKSAFVPPVQTETKVHPWEGLVD
jgi:hypothetical protein